MGIMILLGVVLVALAFTRHIHVQPRDYQLDMTDDSTYIYDNARLVGVIPFDEHSKLDSVLLIDNR